MLLCPRAIEAVSIEVPLSSSICPNCEQPLKWIEKYQRYCCYSCKKYAPVEKKAEPEKAAEEAPEEAPEEEPKPAVKEDPVKACPVCSDDMKFIEKYSRHYCNACKAYAPKAGAASEKKLCPACKSELKYIKQYNEGYCYKCKKYPLRPTNPVLLL